MFLNAGLDRYQSEESVFQISGYGYPAHDQSTSQTFFLPMVSCWGWATWSRAWAKFDLQMSALGELDLDPVARRRFNIDDTYDYYGMACKQRQGSIDSWGIRWQLTLFANDGLVLYPRDTLVTNIGVDDSGTHGMGEPSYQVELTKFRFSVEDASWPASLAVDEIALAQTKQLLRGTRPALIRRALRWIGVAR
jgi:hypothetical protein